MKNNHWIGKAGVVILATTAALLAGCITYMEPAPPPQLAVYTPPPPPPNPEPTPVYVAPPSQPAVVVEIHAESDFYEPLNPYGRWVEVEGYGRCWTPTGVDRDWRPYVNGHWQRTDAGWYWVSDEQWGWATYHYGRWNLDANYGWVWVPQTLWAPAWVSWREGGGYTGWAPLPPEARMGVRGDLEFRHESIEPRAFVYVEQRRLIEPHLQQTIIVNNTTIINNTVNITQIHVVNKTVINEGPRPDVVERASGHKVEVLPVHELRSKQEAMAVAAQRNNPPLTERKFQPPARPKHEIPDQKAQTANPPHPAPVKPVVHEPQIVRPGERIVPAETRKPLPEGEHRPVVETKKPEVPAPKPRPEIVTTPKPPEHPELRHEPRPENQHEATVNKPGQPVLTPQQKLAQDKKRQAEEKKRLEEEKAGKPPQQ